MKSIFLAGGDRGVLLLHGFTGLPQDMLYLGERLHAADYTVSIPLLAGHGRNLAAFTNSTNSDWYRSASEAFFKLSDQCRQVFVGGLSMGGLLTLRLAFFYGESINAIALFAVPIFLKGYKPRVLVPFVRFTPLRYFIRYGKLASRPDIKKEDVEIVRPDWGERLPMNAVYQLSHLRRVCRRYLPGIKNPAFIAHSRKDHRTPLKSADYLCEHLGSEIKDRLNLVESYHVITNDCEKELVADRTIAFFDRFSQ